MEEKLFPGDTLARTLYFRDKNDNLVDPSNVTVTIKDPNGNVQATLNLNDLTKVGTGIYELKWNIPSDAVAGTWKMLVTAQRGSDQNTEPYFFDVEEP